jgi:hypothetical protein
MLVSPVGVPRRRPSRIGEFMRLKENAIYKADWKKIVGEVGWGVKEGYKIHLLTLGEFFRYERRSIQELSNGDRCEHCIVTVIDGEIHSVDFDFLRENAAPILNVEYLIEVTEANELAKAHLLGL